MDQPSGSKNLEHHVHSDQDREKEDDTSEEIANQMAQLKLDGQAETPTMSEVLVYFDLETTGLEKDREIIQVSAVHGKRTFNAFVLPHRPIKPKASQVNHFTVVDGKLCHRGKPVETVTLHEALQGLIDFLDAIPADVWLAAHNAKRFDKPSLERALESCSLQDPFRTKVTAYVDTMLLAKRLYPELKSYRQEKLVKKFLDESYDAHNAIEDARILQKLCNSWRPTRDDLVACRV